MSPVVGICDYGVGNLRSVERALRASGARTLTSDDPDAIAGCDALVLPGVGAFAIAARALNDTGLGGAVRHVAATGVPVLGVCLGHQLLFERSEEGDSVQGLGLLDGRVVRLVPGDGAKVPHMGWNTLLPVRTSRLLDGIAPGTYMYFVHSYAAAPAQEDVVAMTEHGHPFAAAVERENLMGTQFHPEKSGTAGLRVYANFVALCAAQTPVTRAG
ncbi:MAG: imidazole glycerol phosphate synthase subunit HisH [Candidatus Dormiibacterota bacterium]